MPTANRVHSGQAIWVIEQLLKERRITQAEVRQYLRELPDEIQAIEARLQMLRDHASAPTVKTEHRTAKKTRRQTVSGRLGQRFSGLIRHLPASVKRRLQHVKTTKGVEAAVRAAEQLGRRTGA